MRTSSFAAGLLFAATAATAHAQFAGQGPRDAFIDTSILRPPAGQKVAIFVFEDYGCPGCAYAHPIEEKVVAATHVAYMRYDFPLEAHIWTFEGATFARYLQDKVSPQTATQYRDDIFRDQSLILSKDDLHHYNEMWMKKHNLTMPFDLGAESPYAKEVAKDRDLGMRLHVVQTPTVVVVTNGAYQVVAGSPYVRTSGIDRLQEIVEGAQKQAGPATPAASTAKKPAASAVRKH